MGSTGNGIITWGTNSGMTITGEFIITSQSATVIATTSAQFNSHLNDLGTYASLYLTYQYGKTTNYELGVVTTITTAIATIDNPILLTGLTPNTTYHYRAIAYSGSVYSYGTDISFTTSGSSAAGGSTNPMINTVNVFRNYTSPTAGDVLLVTDITCTYPPYYPNSDPTQIFSINLYNVAGTAILGSSVLRNWNERPESIYFNSTFVSSNITWGSAYILKLESVAANVSISYTLTINDWKGFDLTVLDSWCVSTAKNMEISDSVATGTYVTSTTGQGYQITDIAGAFFTIGIPDIGNVRPYLFTTSNTHATITTGTSSNTWDKPDADVAGWRSYVGAVIAGDVDNMAIPFGVSGKDMAAFVVMAVVLGAVMLLVSTTGGFGALGALLLGAPIIWLGVWFRILPIAVLIFAALLFGLLAIRQFIIKPL